MVIAMANVHAIHSVGESLATYLNNSYELDPLHTQYPCQFRLDSSGELLATASSDYGTTNTSRLSLFLYRITVNEHLRNTSQANGFSNTNIPLALDLHYLIAVWANHAAAEHTILAWMMRQFYLHPILDISSLRLDGGWTANDFIQLIPAELSNRHLRKLSNPLCN
jgi:hypothetical protein